MTSAPAIARRSSTSTICSAVWPRTPSPTSRHRGSGQARWLPRSPLRGRSGRPNPSIRAISSTTRTATPVTSRALGGYCPAGVTSPEDRSRPNGGAMNEPHAQRPPTTTDAGIPVASQEHSLTVGPDGPILLQDFYLIEQMANFNRERIPERQPHAKGGGAFGSFVVTDDVSRFTRAAVFQPGAETEVVLRFSTVAGERGSPDTWRDPRGFAVRFYTSDGNLDIVGNNTPVFFIRDPIKFQNFIRSQKRLASSNLRDPDMQWDFWTLSPESSHQVALLMGDRGIPRSWRHMNGYSSHTYMWVNARGERFWVKYHFKCDQGVEFLTQAEAERIAGQDADYHQRDLFEAIQRRDFPSWTLHMQIMPFDDAKAYRFNP